MKVHILEGSKSNGDHIYACGRTAPKNAIRAYVGRAKLVEYGSEVTCLNCQQKYGLVLALIERSRIDPEAPDAIAMVTGSTE